MVMFKPFSFMRWECSPSFVESSAKPHARRGAEVGWNDFVWAPGWRQPGSDFGVLPLDNDPGPVFTVGLS